MIKICQQCGKQFYGRKENKYCSKTCANTARRGIKITKRITKTCEWCGKEFETTESQNKNPKKAKRFCSTSCSAFWRNKTYGSNKMSEPAKQRMSRLLHERWQNPEFREKKIESMKEHNPVYIPGVVEKANKTKLQRGKLPNNFKYGNGKISKYEALVYDDLIGAGFYYNYAINTKLARDAFPEKHYAKNYKPDFVHTIDKLCIEIDGPNHNHTKELDTKKEECLRFLGFTVIRFTHEQIDKGEFKEWLNSFLNE